MTRTRNNTLRLLTSLAIVMLMSVSLILPALANPPWVTGTEDKPAPAAITKRFEMPIGTTTPNATFTFYFEKIGVDNKTDPDEHAAIIAAMPGLGDITIEFDGETASNPSDKLLVTINEAKGTKTVVRESKEFIQDNTNPPWPDVGVYKYYVKEVTTGVINTPADAVNSGKSFSEAWYYLEIWVDRDGDTGPLYVKYVNARTVENQHDEHYDGQVGGVKVDPTPGEDRTIKTYDHIDNFSGIVFTNKYWISKGGGDEKEEESALLVKKIVEGNHPDTEEAEKNNNEFTFNVKVTQPDVIPYDPTAIPPIPLQEYSVYILRANGDIEGETKVTSGDTFEVKLKHDDQLMFTDLHVGAKVEVEEVVNDKYKPSYERTFATPMSLTGKATDAKWGFPRDVEPTDPGPHYLPEAATNANQVIFTNTRTGATPTGVDVDDLPYLVMIGLALTGLTGFVLLKSRRRRGA